MSAAAAAAVTVDLFDLTGGQVWRVDKVAFTLSTIPTCIPHIKRRDSASIAGCSASLYTDQTLLP
jgi:hypothetical protein